MNDLAKAWVHELETTDLPQGERVLVDRDGRYCCLGIACKMLENLGKINKGSWEFVLNGSERRGTLPWDVKEMLGLKSSCGESLEGDRDSDQYYQKELGRDKRGQEVYTLAGLNDDAGLSFPEIAAKIRKYEKYLFVDKGAGQ